ncbi:nitronate monooxygenase [Sphingomonas sp. MMS24-JH45]
MDGYGIRAAQALGAVAAQLGTAFVVCPESAASDAHRAALTGAGGRHTAMTRAISGRPARCAGNAFTAIPDAGAPAYPVAYDAGKALHAAATAHGEHGYGAHWAGQGAPLVRTLPPPTSWRCSRRSTGGAVDPPRACPYRPSQTSPSRKRTWRRSR